MTVVPVKKKEMGYGNEAPSNEAPAAPMQQPAQKPMEVPDHTHPEYDQLMVKVQELEDAVGRMSMGGVNQEGLDQGKPMDDKGKPTGGQEPLEDTQGNWEPKKMENLIRKVLKEELKGETERDVGKQLDKAGPDNVDNVPQSDQPANGEAPSGGGFDSDDKLNEEDGKDSEGKVSKPANEHDKLPMQKNKLEKAKKLIEQAKQLMKEANGEDPSQPNPGAMEKDPKKMDNQTPNKSPMGGTEGANCPPGKMVEEGMDEEDKDMEDDKKPMQEKVNIVKETYDKLTAEIKKEKASERQSLVGMTSASNEQTEAAHEEYLSGKEQVNRAVKEYLSKAGHHRALGYMSPPSSY